MAKPASADSAGSVDLRLIVMNMSLTCLHSASIKNEAAVNTAEVAFTSKG